MKSSSSGARIQQKSIASKTEKSEADERRLRKLQVFLKSVSYNGSEGMQFETLNDLYSDTLLLDRSPCIDRLPIPGEFKCNPTPFLVASCFNRTQVATKAKTSRSRRAPKKTATSNKNSSNQRKNGSEDLSPRKLQPKYIQGQQTTTKNSQQSQTPTKNTQGRQTPNTNTQRNIVNQPKVLSAAKDNGINLSQQKCPNSLAPGKSAVIHQTISSSNSTSLKSSKEANKSSAKHKDIILKNEKAEKSVSSEPHRSGRGKTGPSGETAIDLNTETNQNNLSNEKQPEVPKEQVRQSASLASVKIVDNDSKKRISLKVTNDSASKSISKAASGLQDTQSTDTNASETSPIDQLLQDTASAKTDTALQAKSTAETGPQKVEFVEAARQPQGINKAAYEPKKTDMNIDEPQHTYPTTTDRKENDLEGGQSEGRNPNDIYLADIQSISAKTSKAVQQEAGSPDDAQYAHGTITQDPNLADGQPMDTGLATNESKGTDITSALLQSSNPVTNEQQGTDVTGASSQSTNAATNAPQGTDVTGASSQGTNTATNEQQGTDVTGASSQGTNAATNAPQATDVTGASSQGTDAATNEPQGTDVTVASSQGTNTATNEPQGTDVTGASSQGTNTAINEQQGTEVTGASSQGTNTATNEQQGTDVIGASSQGTNTATNEQQGNDVTGASSQGTNTATNEQQGTDVIGASSQGTNAATNESKGTDIASELLQGTISVTNKPHRTDVAGASSQGTKTATNEPQGTDCTGAETQGTNTVPNESQDMASNHSEDICITSAKTPNIKSPASPSVMSPSEKSLNAKSVSHQTKAAKGNSSAVEQPSDTIAIGEEPKDVSSIQSKDAEARPLQKSSKNLKTSPVREPARRSTPTKSLKTSPQCSKSTRQNSPRSKNRKSPPASKLLPERVCRTLRSTSRSPKGSNTGLCRKSNSSPLANKADRSNNNKAKEDEHSNAENHKKANNKNTKARRK